MNARTYPVTLLALLGASAASAQTELTIIGPGPAMAVSPNGTHVVGQDFVSGSTYRWSKTLGRELLTGAGFGRGISSDGSVVLSELGPLMEAAIWDGNAWTGLGGLGAPCDTFLSNPYGLSDDGTVAVGLGWNGCSANAFRWTAGTGQVQLAVEDPSHNSRANNVSGDGQTAVGWEEADFGNWRPCVWWPDGTQEFVLATPANPDGTGLAWGVSTDGTWITGESIAPRGAWIYSQATGPIELELPPNAPAGTFGSGRAISDDGTVVIGNHGAFGAMRAFIWRQGAGTQWLDEFLTAQGVEVPGPGDLFVTDMTPDGKRIVGHTLQAIFIGDSFIIDFDADECGAVAYGTGASSANTLALSGSGGTGLGQTLDLETQNAAGPFVATGVALGASSFPLFGGTVLLDPTQLVGSLLIAFPTAGSATSSVPIPSSASFAGVEVFFQSFSPDASQAEGWGLSNGLALTICP